MDTLGKKQFNQLMSSLIAKLLGSVHACMHGQFFSLSMTSLLKHLLAEKPKGDGQAPYKCTIVSSDRVHTLYIIGVGKWAIGPSKVCRVTCSVH